MNILACSTLYRAYPIATPQRFAARVTQVQLAVPSTGPIPLRPSCTGSRSGCSSPLAVPSTGPIPLRPFSCLLRRARMQACSTLYRAYPIATTLAIRVGIAPQVLQYPLPGLSHCDMPLCCWRLHQDFLAVPSTGPIPLRPLGVFLPRVVSMGPCSTLYRAYPIATWQWITLFLLSSTCSTLYRAYPIATPDRCTAHRAGTTCSTLYRAYPIATGSAGRCNPALPGLAVPSTGPIPLRREIVKGDRLAPIACSTLYRAYPIATI